MFKKPSVLFAIALLQFVQMLAIANATKKIVIKAHGNAKRFEGELISDRQIQFDNPDDIHYLTSKMTIFYGVKDANVDLNGVQLDNRVAVTEAPLIYLETEFKITVLREKTTVDHAETERDVVARNVVIKKMNDNIWTLHIEAKAKSEFPRNATFRFKAENFNIGFISSGSFVVKNSGIENMENQEVLVVEADIYQMMILQKNEYIKEYTAKYIPCGHGSTGKLVFDEENEIQQNDLFRYTAVGGNPIASCPLRLAINPGKWQTDFSESSYGKQKVKVSWENNTNETVDGTLYSKEGNTVIIEVEVQKLKTNGNPAQDMKMGDLWDIFKNKATVQITEGGGGAVRYTVVGKKKLEAHARSTRPKFGYRITCSQ